MSCSEMKTFHALLRWKAVDGTHRHIAAPPERHLVDEQLVVVTFIAGNDGHTTVGEFRLLRWNHGGDLCTRVVHQQRRLTRFSLNGRLHMAFASPSPVYAGSSLILFASYTSPCWLVTDDPVYSPRR